MNRPVHFEIQADNFDRAKKFYGDVFGWTFPDYPMADGTVYVAIMTAPADSKEQGINGGLVKRPAKTPDQMQGTNAYTVTMLVENYDETATKIMSSGGVEAMAKFAIPGMAWQGYYLDTEGNVFGIHQADKNAK